jgi:hypothetical protein
MKIKSILEQIGLYENPPDPCLFTGAINDPSNPADSPSSSPLTLGIYVDDFIYFSEDPAVKQKFETLLSSLVTVEFMGTVEWFLGTHFQWHAPDDIVSVHLSQTAAHLVEDNNIHTHNITPNASHIARDFLSMPFLNWTNPMTAVD